MIYSNLPLTHDSIWGLSEGGHRISIDAEIISYAVLDVLAKPVSCTVCLS